MSAAASAAVHRETRTAVSPHFYAIEVETVIDQTGPLGNLSPNDRFDWERRSGLSETAGQRAPH